MQREQFLEHAAVEETHWWFTARRKILGDLLACAAPSDRSTALVDFGAGTGGNAGAFAAHYHVLAVDPSPQAVAVIRKRHPAVDCIESDDPECARQHLAHGGVLLSTDVLEHVADDRMLLAHLVDIVPSGGHLLLTVPADPALWSQHDVEFGHFRRYRLAEFRDLWRELPVTERLLSPFNARLRPLIAMARRLRRSGGDDLQLSPGPFNGILHRIFAGESAALCRAVDRGTQPFARGVSLVALLRKS